MFFKAPHDMADRGGRDTETLSCTSETALLRHGEEDREIAKIAVFHL